MLWAATHGPPSAAKMSQGHKAVPEGGAAGGVAVTPSQMFEALHVATPAPPPLD